MKLKVAKMGVNLAPVTCVEYYLPGQMHQASFKRIDIGPLEKEEVVASLLEDGNHVDLGTETLYLDSEGIPETSARGAHGTVTASCVRELLKALGLAGIRWDREISISVSKNDQRFDGPVRVRKHLRQSGHRPLVTHHVSLDLVDPTKPIKYGEVDIPESLKGVITKLYLWYSKSPL